ncbi:hypothetical protein A7M79_19215 [Acinetobacter baumannii]|uniref:hypothetical protein n=1 Tax=Acinetobacter baumannii TaxID=470 RepID=UPI0008DD93CD|nr:hypothetical protein [Acinetobacter baumannii]OIH01733.1 hypothetical protein A7M79_19215 [Acinetobacter baumannii]
MKTGSKVNTPFGQGIIVGVDLPESNLRRFIVEIIKPTKSHNLIEKGEPLCFFPKEISLFFDHGET